MGDESHRKRLRVVIKGRVQGVGFRYFVIERARELHLVGLVRNLRNGDVEVIAEGEDGPLDALLASLHVGPRMGHVDNVIASKLAATDEFKQFSIASTQ